jgi:hypothetical protein
VARVGREVSTWFSYVVMNTQIPLAIILRLLAVILSPLAVILSLLAVILSPLAVILSPLAVILSLPKDLWDRAVREILRQAQDDRTEQARGRSFDKLRMTEPNRLVADPSTSSG